MYLRKTQRKNKDGSTVTYLALAHNVRDPVTRKPKAEILCNFGRADPVDRQALVRLCRSIARLCGVQVHDPQAIQRETSSEDWPGDGGIGVASDLRVVGSYEIGTVHVIDRMWERLGIGTLLRDIVRKAGHRVPFERAVLAMVANRLCAPTSKLGVSERWLDTVHLPSCKGFEVEQFYVAMDILQANAERIERHVFMQARNLYSLPVDVIFYDCTTASFAIDEEDDDSDGGLRLRGYSKSGTWAPQVVIALAVTQDGIPVRSWVLPGNTAEVSTVKTVKRDLGTWKLGRCLFVGDSAMNSQDNRRALSEYAGRYLLATRAGSVTEVKVDVIGRPGRYRKLDDSLEVKEVELGPAELGQRYFVCFNPKEAQRQRKHRQAVVARLREELARHSNRNARAKWAVKLLASQRTGPYLSVTEDGELRIDMAKVRAVERLDGKWVLQTNDPKLTSEQAARGYKAMQTIEQCFAKLKSVQIAITPMHHRVGRRIEAHVKICVLALALQTLAERECGQSWARIHHSLAKLHAVEFTTANHRFFRRTELASDTATVLKNLEISPPKPILDVQEIT